MHFPPHPNWAGTLRTAAPSAQTQTLRLRPHRLRPHRLLRHRLCLPRHGVDVAGEAARLHVRRLREQHQSQHQHQHHSAFLLSRPCDRDSRGGRGPAGLRCACGGDPVIGARAIHRPLDQADPVGAHAAGRLSGEWL